jgi:hypothetical protein
MVDNIDVKQIFRSVSTAKKVKKLNGQRNNGEHGRFGRDLEEKDGQRKEGSMPERPSEVSKRGEMGEGKEKKAEVGNDGEQNTGIERERRNTHHGRKIDILV